MEPSFDLVEFFHVRLLRGLSERLRGRAWALKGGVCLRLFHRSPRLSEDMDLDVDPRVGQQAVAKAVDTVLESAAFLAALAPRGVTALKLSRPKQIPTTQRWKVLMSLEGGGEAHTKVEFSRRRAVADATLGVPDPALLAAHHLPPFPSPHYGAREMARQKAEALASPSRNAPRDLFDLHHLLTSEAAPAREALAGLPRDLAEGALAKAASFRLADMEAQVLPFLPADLAGLWRQPDAFLEMRRVVEKALKP